MRFRTPELFLGAFLTIAVFCVGMLFSLQYFHPATLSPAQQETAANGNSAKNPTMDLAWLSKDASGFFTFWLVVIGSFQAILFLVQLKLIRDSLDEAKEAS
jgi:hypothetical protein